MSASAAAASRKSTSPAPVAEAAARPGTVWMATPAATHCAALSGKLTPKVAAYTPTRSIGPAPSADVRSKLHLMCKMEFE